MAQLVYRANLSAKSFPFMADHWGQTVIVPQYDNTYNRQTNASASSDTTEPEAGIPQIYYCHNVLPTEQGFQSVGFIKLHGFSGGGFARLFELRQDTTGNVVLCAIDFLYNVYTLAPGGGWAARGNLLGTFSTGSIGGKLNAFHTNGESYLFCECKNGTSVLVRYDFSVDAFVAVTASGLDMTQIIYMSTASGYVTAATVSKIFWSSTLPISGDTIDFNPSLVTGAGSTSVEAIRGSIVFMHPLATGFNIYTTENAVSGIFQSNVNLPFYFREVPASDGVTDPSLLALDANTGSHWVYSNSGVQNNTATSSNTTLPEVTDFLSGMRSEYFHDDLGTFSFFNDTGKYKRVSVVLSRYLVFSYGTGVDGYSQVPVYNYAIIYDLILRRWGKIRLDHVQCFEYRLPNSQITEPARQSMAFMDVGGNIYIADLRYSNTDASGCIVLGKYQVARSRTLTLDIVTLEQINPAAPTSIRVLTALNGRDTVTTQPTQLDVGTSGSDMRSYGCRATGVNHSIAVLGAFRLNSIELTFHLHGRR